MHRNRRHRCTRCGKSKARSRPLKPHLLRDPFVSRLQEITGPSSVSVFSVEQPSFFLLLLSNLLFPLQPDLVSLRPVIHERFLEPGMLEGLFGGDPFLRIVDEDPLQQVEELFVERGVGWDRFLDDR